MMVVRRALAVGAVLVALASCSDTDGDGDLDADPVTAAQQSLERAETARDEADAALEDASARFCDESAEYIEAVDRYGGLFTDAEATVGDVTTAGADLQRPREAVTTSAGDLREARDALAAAEQDVADAEIILAEAETGTTGRPAEDTTTTTEALVPDEAVDRVERAEADLAGAFEGVDDSTPLVEATQQVNAAAVSVQVAWMQLFASAGCLADDQQQEAVTAVADYTRALQSALTAAGYYEGEADGVYGPSTVEAVEQLQSDAGLPTTGLVDRATAEALDAAVAASGSDVAAVALAHTAALQTVLTVTGHWTGPIDGEWTDALTAALQAFQTDLGVEPTGVVDPATVAAAQRALDDATAPAGSTTTTETDGTTTSTTP